MFCSRHQTKPNTCSHYPEQHIQIYTSPLHGHEESYPIIFSIFAWYLFDCRYYFLLVSNLFCFVGENWGVEVLRWNDDHDWPQRTKSNTETPYQRLRVVLNCVCCLEQHIYLFVFTPDYSNHHLDHILTNYNYPPDPSSTCQSRTENKILTISTIHRQPKVQWTPPTSSNQL